MNLIAKPFNPIVDGLRRAIQLPSDLSDGKFFEQDHFSGSPSKINGIAMRTHFGTWHEILREVKGFGVKVRQLTYRPSTVFTEYVIPGTDTYDVVDLPAWDFGKLVGGPVLRLALGILKKMIEDAGEGFSAAFLPVTINWT